MAMPPPEAPHRALLGLLKRVMVAPDTMDPVPEAACIRLLARRTWAHGRSVLHWLALCNAPVPALRLATTILQEAGSAASAANPSGATSAPLDPAILTDDDGNTPLHLAATAGSVRAISLLMSTERKLTANRNGYTELRSCAAVLTHDHWLLALLQAPLLSGLGVTQRKIKPSSWALSDESTAALLSSTGKGVGSLPKKLPLLCSMASLQQALAAADPALLQLLTAAAVRPAFMAASPSLRTAVLWHSDCLDHQNVRMNHQEDPGRVAESLRLLTERMDEMPALAAELHIDQAFPLATIPMLRKVHSKTYVDALLALQSHVARNQVAVPLTPMIQRMVKANQVEEVKSSERCDTSFSTGSFRAALRAAGAAVSATLAVMQGTYRRAFAMGVHGLIEMHDCAAEMHSSCGFCLLNNVAVAAVQALEHGAERVAIIDLDVHHGNGTAECLQALLDRKPDWRGRLLLCSVHLYDLVASKDHMCTSGVAPALVHSPAAHDALSASPEAAQERASRRGSQRAAAAAAVAAVTASVAAHDAEGMPVQPGSSAAEPSQAGQPDGSPSSSPLAMSDNPSDQFAGSDFSMPATPTPRAPSLLSQPSTAEPHLRWSFYPGTGAADVPELGFYNCPLVPLWRTAARGKLALSGAIPPRPTSPPAGARDDSLASDPAPPGPPSARPAAGLLASAQAAAASPSSTSSAGGGSGSVSRKPGPTPPLPPLPHHVRRDGPVRLAKSCTRVPSPVFGSGRTAWRAALSHRLLPLIEEFSPDLILVSAGFDGGTADAGNSLNDGRPLGGLNLRQQDFEWAGEQLSQLAGRVCDGKLVAVLEGGYGRVRQARSSPEQGSEAAPAAAGQKRPREEQASPSHAPARLGEPPAAARMPPADQASSFKVPAPSSVSASGLPLLTSPPSHVPGRPRLSCALPQPSPRTRALYSPSLQPLAGRAASFQDVMTPQPASRSLSTLSAIGGGPADAGFGPAGAARFDASGSFGVPSLTGRASTPISAFNRTASYGHTSMSSLMREVSTGSISGAPKLSLASMLGDGGSAIPNDGTDVAAEFKSPSARPLVAGAEQGAQAPSLPCPSPADPVSSAPGPSNHAAAPLLPPIRARTSVAEPEAEPADDMQATDMGWEFDRAPLSANIVAMITGITGADAQGVLPMAGVKL